MVKSISIPTSADGLRVPGLADILRAEARIRPYLAETPVLRSHNLGELLGADVYLKCEHLHPIGAFKVRGGINLVSAEMGMPGGWLPPSAGAEEQPGSASPQARAADNETNVSRPQAFVTASTGNHGQSIAYAARLFGAAAYIFVPERPNPLKAAAMRRFGAHVIEQGRDFDEAREAAVAYAQQRGFRYVHPVREPLLIEGVATHTLELLRRVPDVDVIIVPVGAGSGACGAAIVAKSINPSIEVIAVQAEAAPAVYESWRTGRIVEDGTSATVAEGMATRVAYRYAVDILRALLDDFVVVSDEEITAAMRTLLYSARQVVEESGAAPLAAALRVGDRIRGKKVGLIVSGGNVPEERLREIAAG